MKKRALLLALSSIALVSCGNQTSFSMIEPYSTFGVGQLVTDEPGNTAKVNSLTTDGEYLILNVDLHCNKAPYVSFYYQIQEVEECRFDIDKTQENNKAAFWPNTTIWLNNFDIYFKGYKNLAQNTEYHVDFGVNEIGFACTYFAFSLNEVSSISF